MKGLLPTDEEAVGSPLKADIGGEGVCPNNLESKSSQLQEVPTQSDHASRRKLSYREDITKI